MSCLSENFFIKSKKQLKYLYSNYKRFALKQEEKQEQPMQNMKKDVIGTTGT